MAAGEVASSVALLRLMELVLQTPDWVMRVNQRENAATVMRRMTTRFRQIDDELREQGEKHKTLHGMGTTLTVAASLGTDLFIGHIGDSRAYPLRGEKLHQLTKDHTLAQALGSFNPSAMVMPNPSPITKLQKGARRIGA